MVLRLPSRRWVVPGEWKDSVPIALQLPLPSGTTCQLPPPLGEEAFLLAVFSGDSQPYEPPLCKGRWLPVGQTEGLYVTITAKYNPSVSYADSSPCTGEPLVLAFPAARQQSQW